MELQGKYKFEMHQGEHLYRSQQICRSTTTVKIVVIICELPFSDDARADGQTLEDPIFNQASSYLENLDPSNGTSIHFSKGPVKQIG